MTLTIPCSLTEHKLEVLILDPSYLCMASIGDSAGNLFVVGKLLTKLNDLMENTGVTVLICHHTRKNLNNPFEAPELEDIAWAGFSEWIRQWLLIGRRCKYDADAAPGHHELWLNVGGSAGHSGLWGVDIDEGTRQDEYGRRWDLSVMKASRARQQAAEDATEARETEKETKYQAAVTKNREKIMNALKKFPDGETKTQIRDAAGVMSKLFDPIFADLIQENVIETCEIKKANKQKYDGYRATRIQSDTVGYPSLSE